MKKISIILKEDEYLLLNELAIEQSLMFSTFLRSAIKKFILNKYDSVKALEPEKTSPI